VRKSYAVGTSGREWRSCTASISFCRRGEFAALIGPSGSGKSNAAQPDRPARPPSLRHVVVAGEDAGALDEIAATSLRGRAIGFIFQYHHLLPAFTSLENVMMPIFATRGRADGDMRTTAAALLDRVGLTRWRDHKALRHIRRSTAAGRHRSSARDESRTRARRRAERQSRHRKRQRRVRLDAQRQPPRTGRRSSSLPTIRGSRSAATASSNWWTANRVRRDQPQRPSARLKDQWRGLDGDQPRIKRTP
jgi:hypothetical protein